MGWGGRDDWQAMKAPKVVRVCDGCHEQKPARYRVLQDRYLCDACYYRPTAAPVGVPASSPLAVGAGQTGQTITVSGLSAPKDNDVAAQFDLSHLTGRKDRG